MPLVGRVKSTRRIRSHARTRGKAQRALGLTDFWWLGSWLSPLERASTGHEEPLKVDSQKFKRAVRLEYLAYELGIGQMSLVQLGAVCLRINDFVRGYVVVRGMVTDTVAEAKIERCGKSVKYWVFLELTIFNAVIQLFEPPYILLTVFSLYARGAGGRDQLDSQPYY